MGRRVRWHKVNPLQLASFYRRMRQRQMSAMDRIESSSK